MAGRHFILLVSLLVINVASNAMVINEVMYDPSGTESTDEFIELYNESLQAINIENWRISDGGDTDRIIGTNKMLYVAPHQYVIVLDPDYFEDGSTTYDGLIPEDAVVVTIDNSTFGDRGLSNSNPERITIMDSAGTVIATYLYSTDNLGGRSDEKINPLNGDSAVNWANSLIENGTPGSRNSVTPHEYDASIVGFRWDDTGFMSGDSINIWIVVRNIGLLSVTDSLTLSEQMSDSEIVYQSWNGWSLNPGDSIVFRTILEHAAASSRRFIAALSGFDDNDENDMRILNIYGELPASMIAINEIMYAPEPQRSEWIELYNRGAYPIHLKGWSFGDGTAIRDSMRRYTLPDTVIAGSGFIVIGSDSSIYFENIPVEIPVFVWESFPISLNNTGDSLVVYDDIGQFAERVDYRPSWGDGVAGHSLERISARAAGNDPLNWASSLDSTGSTPGKENSRVMTPSAIGRDLLVLEPNPFSPDGDNKDDILAIRYKLDYPDSRLDIKIYDTRGREVRRIANNEPAGYNGEKLWDGRANDGRFLPTGQYIIYLEASGRGGTRIQSARRVVILARRS